MIETYVQSLLDLVADSPIISTSNITFDKRSSDIGLIRGDLYFLDESRLHFRELIQVKDQPIRYMYAYHYQDADGHLLFRYDDTPHHPNLASFPHHKHDYDETNVIDAPPPDLGKVLQEIESVHSLT